MDEALEQLQAESQITQEAIEEMRSNVSQLQTQVQALVVENQRLGRNVETVAKALHVRIEREKAAKDGKSWWQGWWGNTQTELAKSEQTDSQVSVVATGKKI